MIIIFGTKSNEKKEDKGVFVCPECQNLKHYITKSAQTWFILFFIPVFPVGFKKHKHVECQGCKGAYYERVLDRNEYNLDGTSTEA